MVYNRYFYSLENELSQEQKLGNYKIFDISKTGDRCFTTDYKILAKALQTAYTKSLKN